MSNIERAVEMWVEALVKVWSMLITPLDSWNADVYDVVRNIHAGITIGATALCTALFLYGLIKRTSRLQDLKRPEVVFSSFIKLCIALGITSSSMYLLEELFGVFQAIITKIHGIGEGSFAVSVPEELVSAMNNTSFLESIEVGLFGLLAILIIFIMSIILLIVAWGRYLNVYLHIAVSGLFFAFFSAEETTHIGVSFLKSFANASFRGVVIAIALVLYSVLMSTSNEGVIDLLTNENDTVGAIMLYMKDFLVGGFVTLGICKAGDQIAQRMGF